MRVLVTGASGYIGGALVRRLAQDGHEVVAMLRRPTFELPTPSVTFVEADIRDRERLADVVGDIDGVCHLAAARGVRASFQHPTRYYDVNVAGTAALLDVLGRTTRFVFASTAAVYGESQSQPIPETQTPSPTSPYGASKLATEQLLSFECATGRTGGISLRAFNVSGGAHLDESRLIPKVAAVAAGRVPILEINGDGGTIRDYIHVDDLTRAYVAALHACVPGTHRVYNVGATAASVRQIVDVVEQVSQRTVPIIHRPAQPEPPVLIADTQRIHDELGWTPSRSTLAEIITDVWTAQPPA